MQPEGMPVEKARTTKGWFPDLSRRSDADERLQDPRADPDKVRHTLSEFRIVNRLFSRIRTLTLRHIMPDIARRGLRSVTLLDVGSGGGDFARWFAGYCAAKGIGARVFGLDIDPRAVDFARGAAPSGNAVRIIEGDALSYDMEQLKPDYIVANHLLHHLSDAAIPDFLSKVYRSAGCGVLVADLARSRAAYLGFSLVAPLLFARSYTFADGMVSIRRGFKRSEIAGYLERARLESRFRIGSMLPARIYLLGMK